MTSRYDIWKTASPPEVECCEECWKDEGDGIMGTAVPAGCYDEDCHCHSDDDGDAAFDAMRDDELTEV